MKTKKLSALRQKMNKMKDLDNIEKVLDKLDLPTKVSFDFDKALSAGTHDKKQNGKAISCVYVKKIGSYEMKDMMADELSERLSTLEVQ